MERRKKGSGRITYVEGRKSPWRATVTDGRGKQKTRFFKTEKEAKAFLRDINADASKLKALTESGVTFAAFSQIFLDEKKKGNMKVLAYKALEDQVKRVCTFVGTAKLSDIDSDMVQQMVFALAEQGYSESVMTKAKIAAFSVLKMAAAKHYIDTVPVLNITIPRAKKQDDDRQAKKNWLRDDELALYEAECRRTYVPKKYTKYAGQTLMVHPAGHKLLFILHTGLRLGEALALTWTDYDEYSKTVMIDKNTVYADGEKITQMPKTESGERLIILNRQAVQDLECLRRQFDEQSREIEQRKAEELAAGRTEVFRAGAEVGQAENQGEIRRHRAGTQIHLRLIHLPLRQRRTFQHLADAQKNMQGHRSFPCGHGTRPPTHLCDALLSAPQERSRF